MSSQPDLEIAEVTFKKYASITGNLEYPIYRVQLLGQLQEAIRKDTVKASL